MCKGDGELKGVFFTCRYQGTALRVTKNPLKSRNGMVAAGAANTATWATVQIKETR